MPLQWYHGNFACRGAQRRSKSKEAKTKMIDKDLIIQPNKKDEENEMMQRAQDMQRKMQESQQKLAVKEVQGEAGGGMIKVTLSCQFDMKKISIDPALLKEPGAVIEDLIIAAYNNAKKKVEEAMRQMMLDLTRELGLPDDSGVGGHA